MTRWQWILLPIGVILVLAATLALFGFPVLDSLRFMFEGAFGGKFGLHRTLVKSTPLILVGMGVVLAWRGGVFNIGGEGQLLTGVLFAAALFQSAPQLPGLRLWLLLAAATGGAFCAGIAAWAFAKRGVNIVISTILLNFIVQQVIGYSVRGPLQESTHTIPQTASLPHSVMFGRPDPQTDLHWGVLLVPVLAFLVHFFLHNTVLGYQLRLVGSNYRAARAASINHSKVQVVTLCVSGALCGLAGGIEYVGVSGYLYEGFSPGWGFLGISVALLGGLSAWGVVLSGLLFGALISGTKQLEAFGNANFSIVYVVQGAVLLGFIFIQYLKSRNRWVAPT